MFSDTLVSISTKHRASGAHLFSEVIATLGLLLVIFSLARTKRGTSAPAAVGAYIGAAYFFTSSTSFANPAIDVGRMFSNTFAGIAPASVVGFVVAQLVGGAAAIVVIRYLYPDLTSDEAAEAVLPHADLQSPRPTSTRNGEPMSTVLFVCLQNAGRSQMSSALFEQAAHGDHHALLGRDHACRSRSPRRLCEVMRELDIDLSDRNAAATHPRASRASRCGCHDGLWRPMPLYPRKRYLDWELPDPSGQAVEAVRATRDEIATRVKALLDELNDAQLDGLRRSRRSHSRPPWAKH